MYKVVWYDGKGETKTKTKFISFCYQAYQSFGLVSLQMLFHGVLVGSVVVKVVEDSPASFFAPHYRAVLDLVTILVATTTLLAVVAHFLPS